MKTYTAKEAQFLLGVDNKTFARWLGKAGITLQAGKYDERQKRITHEELERLATQHERTLGELPPEREAHPTVKALERKFTDQAEQLAELGAALRVVTEQLHLLSDRMGETASELHNMRVVFLSDVWRTAPEELKEMQARMDTLEQRLSLLETTPATKTTPGRSETATKRNPPRAQPLLSAGAASTSSELPAGLVSARSFAKEHGIHENTLDKAIASGRLTVITGKWKVGNAYVQKALDARGRARFYELYRGNPHFRQCSDPECPCHE